jgi:sigma-B regulation protein RsbU (phosphoserine phosphatase)
LVLDKIISEIALMSVKFSVILFTFLYSSYIRSKKNSPPLSYLKLILGILAVRELVYGILNITIRISKELNLEPFNGISNSLFFLAITDIIWLTVLFRWLRSYTGKNGIDSFFLILNIVVGAFFVASAVIPGFNFIGDLASLFYWLWELVFIVTFVISILGVSKFNVNDPELILDTRITVIIILGLGSLYLFLPANPAAAEYNTTGALLQTLALCGFYSAITYILHYYNLLSDRDREDEVDFIEKDLESVFDFMKEVSKAMAEKVGMDKVLEHIITSTVKTTSADAGAILMIDEYEDILKVRAVSGFFPPLYSVPDIVKTAISRLEAYFKSTPIRLGETIFGECQKAGQPIFIRNSLDDQRLKNNTKNDTLYVNCAILIPLIVQTRVLGVLAVLNRDRNKFFTDNDYTHLTTFGEYAALTIDFVNTYMQLLEKKEIEREIGIAADIQQKLLPKKLPKIKNAVLEAYSVPAKGVSGDYYDAFQLKGGKLALVICDVAGKGVPAALVMVMIRSILHLIASSDREVQTMLTWVNRGISGEIDIDHYATMSILTYDQNTSEIVYSNAAHHPLLIFRHATKQVETLDTEGLPIGIEKSTAYTQKKIKLDPGDLIILYTDGIIEAMNAKGEQYSTERFQNLIRDNAGLTPKELLDVLKEDLDGFVKNAKQHDDQTLLLMKVN